MAKKKKNADARFIEFLNTHPVTDSEVLIELAIADLIQQLKENNQGSARVEHYLNASKLIAENKNHTLDLIDAEISPLGQWRASAAARLPGAICRLEDELTRLFDIHRLDLEAAGLEATSRSQTDPRRVGGYDLIRPFTGHCDGKYWFAKSPNSDQLVVLCWYTPEPELADEKLVSRLGQLLVQFKQWRHTNVLSLLDYGVEPDLVFLAFAYNGELGISDSSDFRSDVRDKRFVATILRQIIGVTESAAEHGVSYCGLRARDVVIANKQPRLMDFGLQYLVELVMRGGADDSTDRRINAPF